ncbi:MAG TPA: glycosyltransferase family 1 protein, partial [Chthoniobacterales bacterium]
DQLHDWLKTAGVAREGQALGIGFSHHGADLRASLPTTGLTAENRLLLDKLRERPCFLMVGTVEPRKGHRQALSAMERLWAAGADVNLVMIGKQGWMMETFAETVRQSPEYGRRLFWPQAISDEVLEHVYRGSRALLAASYGEGFGLPLIEAAHYGLPIIARDLPVFREVAGEHAFYFQGETPEGLAAALQDWLSRKKVPESAGVARLTWNESATRLLKLAVNGEWDFEWPERPSPTLLGESALKR